MKRILITGANRGLGLELARQYTTRGERVFATCRQPQRAEELGELAAQHPDRLTIIPLDVTDQQSIDASYDTVREHTDALDVFINNAGIREIRERELTLDDLEADAMLRVFQINVVGPAMMIKRYVDLLQAGSNPLIVNVSSRAGSISLRDSKVHGSYAISKAALNMLTRVIHNNLKPQGIATVAVHPGWVRTDMGGPEAPRTPEETMAGLIRVIDGLTLEDSGRFLQWDGQALPW
jgi:NAD(P)-dependent dehydrogenase (short-subunit alcohol dehydrogenase family)